MIIFILLNLLVLSSQTLLPKYGFFCGKNFTVDDHHIANPLDGIDRMCQIYGICVDAMSQIDNLCFCNQQALHSLQNMHTESNIKTLFYNIILKQLGTSNCSKIYTTRELETSYGLSDTSPLNFLTFYPQHLNDYLDLPVYQNLFNKYPGMTYLYFNQYTEQEYAEFIIKYKGETCAYMKTNPYNSYLIVDYNVSRHEKIPIDKNKILVILANDYGECYSTYKMKLNFTFEAGKNKLSVIIDSLSYISIVLSLISIFIMIYYYKNQRI